MHSFLSQLKAIFSQNACILRRTNLRRSMNRGNSEPLEARTMLAATIVKDVHTISSPNELNPSQITAVGNTVFFVSTVTGYGAELWKSDGTAAGTVLVKDILNGSGGSNPDFLTNINGILYFRANDSINGNELWKSDGTAAGTVMIKDIRSGISPSNPRYLTNVNGTLHFAANDGTNGYELWKSDGTAAGTVMIKDIRSGISPSNPRYLTNVNGTLFFRAGDGLTGDELWKSDGTASGTELVKDILLGNGHSSPAQLTNVNGTLYFRAADSAANGFELWRSDGTSSGTTIVKEIVGTGAVYPVHLTNVSGTLYFIGNDGSSGHELWKSDGTSVGTVMVKDIRAGSDGSIASNLTNVNGTVYFTANDGSSGHELWKSDGTAVGTAMVRDIQNGGGSSIPTLLTNVAGTLLFTANDGVNGLELWRSDGTSSGTLMVNDIWNGFIGSAINALTHANGVVYLRAADGTHGAELWKSDGTTSGTLMVTDFPGRRTESSNPGPPVGVGSEIYFRARGDLSGYELWKSNGTSNGTTLVKDIQAGAGEANPSYLTNVNGTLLFKANDGISGDELWKTDGTDSGTVLVKNIRSGSNGSFPGSLTNMNGTLYFRAEDGTNGVELWKSDGTAAGTVLVKDINSGSGSSSPANLTNVNGTLYFSVNDGISGTELWKSDGTAAGTVLVKDINSGSGSSSPTNLTNINGTLYFIANDGTNGVELWKSNGTSAGTVLVKDIQGGSVGSSPQFLTNVNGLLYFRANDGTNGVELWKSDGTALGTVMVKDILAGTGGAVPNYLTNGNGVLFFSANDGTNGVELWKTDGTTSGTVMVTDLRAGSAASNPRHLVFFNGTVFFQATDGINGEELWESDGSQEGTFLNTDLVAGTAGTAPQRLSVAENDLFFTAETLEFGRELYVMTNAHPKRVLLSPSSISEGSAVGTVVGTLTTVDPDAGDTFTYSFVSGSGDNDNAAFTITGDQLKLAVVPNFEVKNSYSVRIRTTDAGGLTIDKALTVSITNVNEPPSDIGISSNSIAENSSIGTVVGTFATTDPDIGDLFTYSLITEAGLSTGATNQFSIDGNKLKLNFSPDYESNGSYTVTVRSEDSGGYRVSRAFNILITDVNERPVVVAKSIETQAGVAKAVTLSATDPEGAPVTYSISQAPQHGTLSGTAPNLTYTPNAGFVGEDEFYYRASDGVQQSFEAIVSVASIVQKPTVTILSADRVVGEIGFGGATGVQSQVYISLSEAAPFDLLIPFSISGTATRDRDFTFPAEILVKSGQSLIIVESRIIDDSDYEPGQAETITVSLQPSPLITLGAKTSHTTSIEDNDGVPLVYFDNKSRYLKEGQSTDIGVVLSSVSTVDTTVTIGWLRDVGRYHASDNDFTWVGGPTVVIPAGQRRVTKTLTANRDGILEGAEGEFFYFEGLVNGNFSPNPATPTRLQLAIEDNQDLPKVSFEVASRDIRENAGTVTLTATLDAASATPLSVPFEISGTTDSNDRTISPDKVGNVNPVLLFPANTTTASIQITVTDDSLVEGDEKLIFKLSSPSGSYELGAVSETVLRFLDNDTLTVGVSSTATEFWEDVGEITIRATLQKSSATPLSVPFVISRAQRNGATSPDDYQLNHSTFEFAANTTEATRTITIRNDSTNEPTETFVVTLKPASGSGIALESRKDSVTLTIKDDDPFVTIKPAGNGTASEADTSVSYTVELSAATNKEVTVPLVLSGTATKDVHYKKPSSTTVRIPVGKTSGTYVVDLKQNDKQERDTTLTIGVSNTSSSKPANAVVPSNPKSATVTIKDDDFSKIGIYSSTGDWEGTTGSKEFSFTINVEPSVRDISVKLDTSDSTASKGSDWDYDLRKRSDGVAATIQRFYDASFREVIGGSFKKDILVIPAGTKYAFMLFKVFGDKLNEQTEYIRIRMKDVKGASIDSSGGFDRTRFEHEITNGDPPPPRKSERRGFLGGFISGSTLFVDSNFNGVPDYQDLNGNGIREQDEAEEPSQSTDLGGSTTLITPFEFDRDGDGMFGPTEARLVGVGGVDISVNLPVRIIGTAPISSTNVTPLSTVAENLSRLFGMSPTDAFARTGQALGAGVYNIAPGGALLDAAEGDESAVAAYKALVTVSSTVIGISELLHGAAPDFAVLPLSELVYQEIAKRIAPTDSVLDLSDVDVVRALLESVMARTGITFGDELLTPDGPFNPDVIGAATIISEAGRQYAALRLEDFATPMLFLEQLMRVKRVFQGEAATALADAAAEQRTMESVVDDYTGVSLATKIAAAAIGVIIPPTISVGSAVVQEGNSGPTILSFPVTLIGDHSSGVTVNYETSDETTTAGVDYVAAAGTLTWAAGDTSTRYIQVTVNGETDLEGDETIRLVLSGATNAVIDAGQVAGTIQDDENVNFTTSSSPTDGSNRVFLVLSADELQLNQNGNSELSIDRILSTSAGINGRDSLSDHLTVDFTANSFRTDTVSFDGGNGSTVDRLTLQAGAFELVYLVQTGAAAASITADPLSDEGPVQVSSTATEAIDVYASSMTEFRIQLVADVGTVILQDADPDSPGRMTLSSPSGRFAPIEFTSPDVTLRLLSGGGIGNLTILSLDPAFSGAIVSQLPITPSDLNLSSTSILENQSAGTAIGTLSTIDADSAIGFTYDFVNGLGSDDNGSFLIDGSSLKSNMAFNFESKNAYKVRIRSTDPDGLSVEKWFTIHVTDINEAPTNLSLSNSSIPENAGADANIGTLSGSDPDAADTLTFSLPSGLTNNNLFNVNGTSLRANASFDFEAASSYTVTVRATDAGGLYYEQQIVITVTDVNENSAPTNISLSNSSVAENLPSGTSVGNLSTTDPDAGDSFTYSLVTGAGDADNGSFTIDGNALKTAAVFNFETKSSYSIRVRSTDQGGLSFEKVFMINVLNVTELGGIDVQLGQSQRSYVRYLDILFDRPDDILDMINNSRFQLTKRDLNGLNPVNVPLTPSMFSQVGNSGRIDFGTNGLGGNRNSNVGDGYYQIGIDMDGNGSFESTRSFYRLLGDVNGDRKVDSTDSSLVTSSFGSTSPERDVNGDGTVNSNDRTLVLRAIGRKLKEDLFADD